MRNLISVAIIFISINCNAQSNFEDIKGFWQEINQSSVIMIKYNDSSKQILFLYNDEQKKFTSNTKYSIVNGFSDTCNIANIDELKNEGLFYLELFSGYNYDEEDGYVTLKKLNCYDIKVQKGENKALMYIREKDSSQQGNSYERLEKLPENLEKYLRKEYPKIYKSYKNNLKKKSKIVYHK